MSGCASAFFPITKNVAFAPAASSASSIFFVESGSGPSSNVSATPRAPCGPWIIASTNTRSRKKKTPHKMIAKYALVNAAMKTTDGGSPITARALTTKAASVIK